MTDRPDAFLAFREQLLLQQVRFILVDVEIMESAIQESGMPPEAILVDYEEGRNRETLLEIGRRYGETIPVVVVFDTIDTAELLGLTELGFSHFRYRHQLNEEGDESYLSGLIRHYQKAGLQREVQIFLEKASQDEFVMLHSVLDSLQSGIMIVRPASLPYTYLIHGVNDTLEFLLEADLRTFKGYPLERMLRSEHIAEEIRRLFCWNPDTVEERELFHLSERRDCYLERVIVPFFNDRTEVLGYLLVFKDVTYEIESDQIDPITGLPGRAQAEKAIPRIISRYHRYADLPCRMLSVLLIDIENLKGYNDEFGEEEGNRLLRLLTRLIRKSAGETAANCRILGDNFLVILPCIPRRRVEQIARNIVADFEQAVRSLAGSPGINIGIVFSAYEEQEQLNREEVVAYMQKTVGGLIQEAEQALYRCRQLGPNRIMFYMKTTGYTEL